jgi:hypothetical protein
MQVSQHRLSDNLRTLRVRLQRGQSARRSLADLCAELEKAGKGEDWDAIEAAMPRLEPSMREVMDYIKAL